mmetsp:Transcript_13714/g.29576  ORF Transcript_13714/g.29576 Transcript_13714/m.29576 type:complete len:221 (-) Transcript_13714:697-1359(-)
MPMAGSTTWLSWRKSSCCIRWCACRSPWSLFLSDRISLILLVADVWLSPALGACIIDSISACSRCCTTSCLLSCSCSCICASSISSCALRLRSRKVSPGSSGSSSKLEGSCAPSEWPASSALALMPWPSPLASLASRSLSMSSGMSDGSEAVFAASRFCTMHLYFCKCDLMFAFVKPSTFISRNIDFGLALSRPSWLHAASNRAWRSGVQTKRRFWCGSF